MPGADVVRSGSTGSVRPSLQRVQAVVCKVVMSWWHVCGGRFIKRNSGFAQPLVTEGKQTYLRQIHRMSFVVRAQCFLLIAGSLQATLEIVLYIFSSSLSNFLPVNMHIYMDVLLSGSFLNVVIP